MALGRPLGGAGHRIHKQGEGFIDIGGRAGGDRSFPGLGLISPLQQREGPFPVSQKNRYPKIGFFILEGPVIDQGQLKNIFGLA